MGALVKMRRPVVIDHEPQPATVERLTELATEIRAAVGAAKDHMRGSLEMALRAGECLVEAKAEVKKKLGHGAWLPWLRKHCELSERSAQVYMRVARKWPELKSAVPADMTLDTVLQLLAMPIDSEKPARGRPEKDTAEKRYKHLLKAWSAAEPPERRKFLGWPDVQDFLPARVANSSIIDIEPVDDNGGHHDGGGDHHDDGGADHHGDGAAAIVREAEAEAADEFFGILRSLPADDLKRLMTLAAEFTLLLGRMGEPRVSYAAISGDLLDSSRFHPHRAVDARDAAAALFVSGRRRCRGEAS